MRHGLIRGVIILLAWLLSSVAAAQPGAVQVVAVNEFLNIRLTPALGAPVITTVNAGTAFDNVSARSGDGEWLRVEYECEQGWINLAPLVVLQGDINALPVADPRSIPFGGFEAPTVGFSSFTGTIPARATDGLRVRNGPSRAYPTITNINFNQVFTLVGRNACGTWLQVNFEGTLGWVSATFVQLIDVGDINSLPVGGIVAEQPLVDPEAINEVIGVYLLMLERLELAQPSIDQARSLWTDAAVAGRAVCQGYPARPSDFPINSALLAANYVPLNSLVTDFNDAMANVRTAIDLFIDVCNLPGTANPVGQATAQGALDVVNLADQQFESLRQRLNELIPDRLEPGPDECLLQFRNEVEILPTIRIGPIYLDEFTRRTFTRGYCFDGVQDQILNLQTLPIPNADLRIFIAVAELENPSEFLVVSRSQNNGLQAVGPLQLPRTTRYVVLVADLGDETATDPGAQPSNRSRAGRFALRVQDITFAPVILNLFYNEDTGAVELTEGAVITTQRPEPETETPQTLCPSTGFSCAQLFSCDEAIACFNAGNFALDANADGTPCGITLCADRNPGDPTGE